MNQIKSLYIHVPFCRHLCNYCDFYKKIIDGQSIEAFHRYLEESLPKHRQFLEREGYQLAELETLYLGGGTPSLWGERGVEFLGNWMIQNKIVLAASCEFTVEVNPGGVKPAELDAWEGVGVNRYSVGIQSLRDDVLKALDRVHDCKDSHVILQKLSQRDANFSVDFIIGLALPKGMKRNIEEELQEILQYSPKHISLYILSVGSSYPWYDQMPEEEEVSEEFLRVREVLSRYGYQQYEVSNYALEGWESQHNKNYWMQKSVAALGPSATGFLTDGRRGLRYKWQPHTSGFSTEELDAEKVKLEKLYLMFRIKEGVCFEDFYRGENLRLAQERALSWVRQGYMTESSSGAFQLNSKGWIIMDSLLQQLLDLDFYL